jgi:hypothetical protein
MNKEAIKVKKAYEEKDAMEVAKKVSDEQEFKQKIIQSFRNWNLFSPPKMDYEILDDEYVLLEIFEYVEKASSLVSLDNSPPITKVARFNIFKVLSECGNLKVGDLVGIMDDSLSIKINEAFIIWDKTKDSSANKLKEPPPKYIDKSESLDRYLFATNKFEGIEGRKFYLLPKNFIKVRIEDGHIESQASRFLQAKED